VPKRAGEQVDGVARDRRQPGRGGRRQRCQGAGGGQLGGRRRGGGEGVEGLHIRRVELPALGAGPRHLLTLIAVRFAVPSLPGGRAR
jgi:hypothetical protein